MQDFPLLLPQVDQSVPKVGQRRKAGVPRRRRRRIGHPHRPQHQHHAQIQRRLHRKVPEKPQLRYQNAANGRPNHPRAGDGQRVDGVGVADGPARHRVGHHHLLNGHRNGQANAGDDDIGVGVPQPHQVAVHQDGEGQGQDGAERLGGHRQFAAIQAVAQGAGDGVDHQAGQDVEAAGRQHQQAADAGAGRQFLDQPADAEQLHPLRAERKKVAEPQQPEIPVGQPGVDGMQAGQSGAVSSQKRDGLFVIPAVGVFVIPAQAGIWLRRQCHVAGNRQPGAYCAYAARLSISDGPAGAGGICGIGENRVICITIDGRGRRTQKGRRRQRSCIG